MHEKRRSQCLDNCGESIRRQFWMYVFTYNPCVDSGEPSNLPRGTHWCRLCAMHVGLHVRAAPSRWYCASSCVFALFWWSHLCIFCNRWSHLCIFPSSDRPSMLCTCNNYTRRDRGDRYTPVCFEDKKPIGSFLESPGNFGRFISRRDPGVLLHTVEVFHEVQEVIENLWRKWMDLSLHQEVGSLGTGILSVLKRK